MIDLVVLYGLPTLLVLLVAGVVYELAKALRKGTFRIGLDTDQPLFRRSTREETNRELRRDALIAAIVIVIAVIYGYFFEGSDP